jgi:hypothetical protein
MTHGAFRVFDLNSSKPEFFTFLKRMDIKTKTYAKRRFHCF